MQHRIALWIHDNSEYLAGFGTSSVVTPTLLNFTLTVIQTAVVALVSGAIGTITAHYIKKYLTKRENDKSKTN